MNVKILLSILTIGVASAATGYGTFAFFSDTETATDNLFTAGDLDLTVDGLNGITSKIVQGNMAPGDVRGGSLVLRNEGTIFTGDAQAHVVDLDMKALVTVTDDLGNPNDPDNGGVSATPFSKFLVLQTLTYDGNSILPLDADGDGLANTLADLHARGVYLDLQDPLAAGKTLAMSVLFLTTGGNDLQNDQVKVDFTFFLSQAGETDLS